jgi:uncharacterized membrane protein
VLPDDERSSLDERARRRARVSDNSSLELRRERLRTFVRGAVTVGMVAIGALHFLVPAPFVAIMPPAIPFPLAMVWISGAAEIALGLGLVSPRTRRWASYGLIALFVAVFPANVYMAVAGVAPLGAPVPPWAAWGRLPLQPLFMLTAWWVGRDAPAAVPHAPR